VLLAWLILAAARAATAASTAGRLQHSFATPGTAGYDANQLNERFGIDGNEQPTLGVLTLPTGISMHAQRGQAIAARVFASASQAGHLAIADYANPGDPKLVTPYGHTTWALFDMPNPDVPAGPSRRYRMVRPSAPCRPSTPGLPDADAGSAESDR
jgi:RND superfamily putative drug exporter